MIRQSEKQNPGLGPAQGQAEPATGRPSETGEAWLGQNRSDKRRLWERLNPRNRNDLRLLAEALALHQTQARLPEPARARLAAAMGDLERLARRVAAILAERAGRTPARR